ncbi:MAG: DtxR family transcriptional regulator [Gemmatimonadetes bacterium]|nr:DtxR family transcriptional regulator [Gemmatimonadota bacterium]
MPAMVDPRLALLVFAVGLLLTALLFRPRHGWVLRLVRRLRTGEREALEDALKHLYKSRRSGAVASLESLAGALEVPRSRVVRIMESLATRGLVHADDPLTLTDEGSVYALQIIRTHRLWERFLADRTGTAPGDWHDRAEMREHEISPAQANRIAASLGFPRYDPHGDPIPTAAGEIPEPEGIPLPYMASGASATVIHVEDEPRELYDRLVPLGISPGTRLLLRESRDGRLRIETDGREIELDLATAGNVTVRPHEGAEPVPPSTYVETMLTLEDLAPGSEGVVVGLAPACQGTQRRRLLDLGVVPGTRIRSELPSASGDPTAYEIRGALIALRREQQRWVRIVPAQEQAA